MAQKHRENPRFQVVEWLWRTLRRGRLSPYTLVMAALAALVAEKARWALWLPVALGVGIGGYFAWPTEPPLAAMWGLFAGAGAAAWGLRAAGRLGLAFCAALVCAGLLGAALSGARTWWVAHPVLHAETGPVTVLGQVVRVEPRPKGPRVTLEHVTVQRLRPDVTPDRVRVSLSGDQPDIRPGDWLRLRANLSPPPAPAAPGAFDFQRQSYFRGLGAVGFGYGAAAVAGVAPDRGADSLRFGLERWRLDLAGRVRGLVPGDAGAVAAALITGVRAAIPEPVIEDMRASGLAHLLAISGLHVGLVAGIVFFSARALLVAFQVVSLQAAWPGWGVRLPAKKGAAALAMAGALFYAVLAGATVPTQRAFLMVALVLLAVLVDRRALSMRVVAWAALVILAFAPEALLGASFQLSFAAVVALVAVYETLSARGWFKRKTNGFAVTIVRYVAGVALTTVIAGAATAAFAAFHFNRVADYGLAANLLAVPVMALWIMPWAVAAFVLMPLGLEGWALSAMGLGIEAVLAVAREVAAWPGAQRTVAAFPVWGLAAMALGGLWAAIWRRPWRAWGMVPFAAGLVSLGLSQVPDMLIDASGRLAAVKTDGGGYVFSTLTAKRFEQGVWLRRAGLETPAGRWQTAELADAELTNGGPGRTPTKSGVLCDALGCVYRADANLAVAFVRAPEALAEDCLRARVVVDVTGGGRAEDCRAIGGAHVIEAADLARKGAHALYFTPGGGVRIDTVAARRGTRPWTAH